MKITSQHNRKLKEIRKLRQRKRWRERAGAFVAEGEDLLAAADAAGWQAVERYCAAGSGLAGIEVEAELLASASGLASGTRALAVYEERWADRAPGPLCVYLHGIHDPGNLGTILRSAEAFGASGVAVGPGTADPFSPKAVRASMGAVFTVPLVKVGDGVRGGGGDGDRVGGGDRVGDGGGAGDVEGAGDGDGAGDGVAGVGDLPGVKIALVPGQGVALPELWRFTSAYAMSSAKVRLQAPAEDPPAPARPAPAQPAPPAPAPPAEAAVAAPPSTPPEITLLIGAERDGLPEAVVEEANLVVHIPTRNDSLNAAMAATAALYELATRMARS